MRQSSARSIELDLYQYKEVLDFLSYKSYPEGYSKNQNRQLRRKCQQNFCIQHGLLFYAKTSISSGMKQEWRQVVKGEEEQKQVLESCHSSVEGKYMCKLHD